MYSLKIKFLFQRLLLVCGLIQCDLAFSQDLSYYKIDDEDGLPSNEVYQTVQDPFGYMWIATDAGLFRYDGARFKEYSTLDQNSRSISNLQFDSKGQLYCQNFTGQIFKLFNDSLVTFFDASKESSQYPSFTIDKNNKVWIGTDVSLHVFNENGEYVKKITNAKLKYKVTGWLAICEKGQQIICVDWASKFFTVDISSFSIEPLKVQGLIGTRHMFFKNGQDLLVFSEQNPQRKYFVCGISGGSIKSEKSIQPEDPTATHYFYKRIGSHLFMGTSNGLMISKDGGAFSKHLFGMKVSDVFKDREGNFWVSTLQDGIIVIPNLEIEVFATSNSALTDRNLYHLASNDNKLYIGTYSGEIFTLENTKSALQKFQKNDQAKNRAIRKILFYKGSTFIACGPFLASGWPSLNELGSLNNIRDMAILGDRLYFTTPDRTGYIDLKSEKPEIIIIRKKGGKKIACDPDLKVVYLACTDGLFSYTNGQLREQKRGGKSIFVNSIMYFGHQLWIGTMSDGVFSASNQNGELVLKEWKELIGKRARAIYVDKAQLWVATEMGLNRISLNSKKNTLFNKNDGVDFIEINDLLSFKGAMYLATIRGLVRFPEYLNGRNNIAPGITISDIKKSGVSLKGKKVIDLYSDDHGLTVNFSTAAFRSRGSFYYEYRIKGFESSWRRLPAASPFAYITGLPAGNFIFQVRAVNEDGIATKQPAELSLVVHAPFYQKWWFILLLTVGIIAIVALIFIVRIRYLKRQAMIKNRLVLSQLTALKAQMNPHFMYNTLSSIQDFIWQNDTKNSSYYLGRFSLLMRKILDASDSSKISLEEEVEILNLYLEMEQLRFGASFSYELTVSEEIDLHEAEIPAMIIQPFIENAIKHGLLHKLGEKKLKIHFDVRNNELHCRIVDNGIGRVKAAEIKRRQAAQHRSFATNATQKRIDLLSLYDDSMYSVSILDLYKNGEASGTQVDLILPFGNS